MVTAVAERTASIALLDIEVGDAWTEYLEATQWLHPLRYEEAEPHAWKRLQTRLSAIEVRRAHLKTSARRP